MRASAWLAILSGLFSLAMALCAPAIMRWQIHNTLTAYGAEKYADVAIAAHVAPVEAAMPLATALSLTVIAAGVLIYLRRKSGLKLLVAIVAIIMSLRVVETINDPAAGAPALIVHGCWWLFVLGFALRKHQRFGVLWWRP